MRNKSRFQSGLAIVMIFALVLCQFPLGVRAAARTVYFENTSGWSNVNIYYWSDSNTGFVSWPGQPMQSVSGTLWEYELPSGVQYVIFNNGSSQTSDLPLPQDKNLYHYGSGQWSTRGCVHQWVEDRVITEATCTQAGESVYLCHLCNQQQTQYPEALGHAFQNGKCSRCGHQQPVIFLDAAGSGWSRVYAYAWTSGQGEYLGSWPGTVMDSAEGLYSIALNPDAKNIIFNNGSGEQTADLVIPTDGGNLYSYATGQWSKHSTCIHDWDPGTITTEVTCIRDGVITYRCLLCGEEQAEVVPSLGHRYAAGNCVNCGAPEPCSEHVWDEGVVTQEQGCWTTGTRTYTCTICSATKDEIIYAGHDIYVAQVIAPTCTSIGKEITKCTRCAYVYDRTLPRGEHHYLPGETVAPSCTVDGYTLMTCPDCGAEAHGQPVYHKGHQWSGSNCTVCGLTCQHSYKDGICSACDKGGPAYAEGYYEIENSAQLYWFAQQVNTGNTGINGKLVADIDLNNGIWTSIGYYLSDSKTPDTLAYTGIFDGQGHTVSNFTTAGTDNEGLFGYCSSATIMNVGVVNARVTGWRAGAVAGYPLTSNVINCFAKDCVITGKTSNSVALLSGTVYIAPVASPQGGMVSNCYALDCTLVDATDLEIFTSPVGGTDTQNGYYCNTIWTGAFSSERNSTQVNREQLASGEVTWLLNKGVTDGTQGWYQTCGQGLPSHEGLTVYQDAQGNYINHKAILGDVTGDGKVNIADVSRSYAHVRGTDLLEGEAFTAADVTGDDQVTIADVSRLYAHCKGTRPLG